jgi:hypothetical protein
MEVPMTAIEMNKEPNETEWLKASLNNSAFKYLQDPEEDIYTINDGKPFEHLDPKGFPL